MDSDERLGGSPATGQVLCLGSINADFQMRVPRRPEVSETLVGHDYLRLGGGKAANVAFLCARLGVRAALFGHVGADDLAEQALAPLRRADIDLRGVRQVPGRDTGMALIAVPPDGHKGILLALNANDEPWSDQDWQHLEAALRQAPPHSVLVADAEMDRTALARSLREARRAGLRVVLDPSPADRVDAALLSLCHLVLPNPGEAQRLTGIECRNADAAARAARRLLEMGAGAGVVKLSDGGCVLAEPGRLLRVKPLGMEAVDTTGAGDAFAGGLAAGLARGGDTDAALRLAVAASQCAVTGYGSQPAYPDWQQASELAGRLEVSIDAEPDA